MARQNRPKNHDKPFVLLSKYFKITSLDVVAWLDKIVIPEHTEETTTRDQITLRPERVLIKPVTEQQQVERLKSEIKDLEQQQAALGSPKQFLKKRLREKGQLDLANDPKERRTRTNRLKREVRWFDKEIKNRKRELAKATKILDDWDKNESHYRIEKYLSCIPGKTVTRQVSPVTFRQLITEGHGFVTVDSSRLSRYESAVKDDLLAPRYSGFGHDENLLIKIAIEAGVFTPDNLDKALEEHPWIAWEDHHAANIEEIEPDEIENRLIIKTSGAPVDGGIHNAGWRLTKHGLKPRALTSFDRGRITEAGGGDQQSDTGGEWSGAVDSDDYSEDSNS